MRFDRVIAVDWSARSKPSPEQPSPDAIWLAVWEGGQVAPPEYLRSRTEAVARIDALLAPPGRVLLGLDFAFGYPPGFAQALTGAARALDVWNWLEDRIEDGPNNENNRWDVARRINAAFPGLGPLWGCPAAEAGPELPAKGSDRKGHGIPERRLVDNAGGTTSPATKLYTTGSVGSQTLLGLPHLARLRRAHPDLAVWPQETGFALPDARITLAEIYPSLFQPTPHEIKDAGQVMACADILAQAPESWFTAPGDVPDADRVAVEEGWILGVGPEGPLPLGGRCDALPAGVQWTPVDTVLATLAGLTPVTGVETVAITAAAGRVLAQDVVARRSNPPKANAAVDGWGYAHGTLPDGSVPMEPGRAAAGIAFTGFVRPGHVLRILTGAELPAGVDTVALQEDAIEANGQITLRARPKQGANTRPAGEDVVAGAPLLAAGCQLRPTDIAFAIAAGHGELPVRQRLRVAVLSTGSEIIPPGQAGPGIHDANRPTLCAMLSAWGIEPVDLGHIPDDADSLSKALERGAQADAILTSGGASAGDEDHLSRLMQTRGEIDHWRIAIKPGRPLMLGRWRGTHLFGLPGNPVAAFTCAALFARPALLRLAGAEWSPPQGVMVPAAFEKRKKAGRREILRARLTAEGAAEIFKSEGSGRVSGLSWAQGFVELPDEAVEIAPGDPVRYLPFTELGLG